MKYHSTFSTIVISLAVLLVFSAVALAVVTVLSMTSPTLIATNEILDGLSSADTPLTVSFESIDRNFRDGVFINGLNIGYEGEDVASFDRVTLHMGLFSLIRYAVFGSGSLEIEAEGGSITIPETFSGGGGSGGGSSRLQLPSVLNNYSLSLRIHESEMSVMDIAKLSGVEAMITLDHGINGLEGTASASSAEVERGDAIVSAEGISLSFAYEDGISADISAGNIDGSYGGVTVSVEELSSSFSLGEDLDLSKAAADMAAEGISAGYDGGTVSLASLSARYDGGISVTLGFLSAGMSGISAEISGAVIESDDLSDIAITLSGVKARKDGLSLISTESLSLMLSLQERNISLSSAHADTSMLSAWTGLFPTISLDGIEASAALSDGNAVSFSFSSDTKLSSDAPEFSGTSLSLSVSGSAADGRLERADAEISDLRLPGIDESARFMVSVEGDKVRFSGRYGSYLSILGGYDRTLTLSMMASSLPLYPLRPVISFFVPAISEYIGEETKATGSVNIGITDAGDGPMGPASLSISLSDIRFNDYAFNASTAFSLYLDKEEVRVDSASITTDFVSATWKGSVDIADKLPEGTFNLLRNDTVLASAVLELSDAREYSFALSIPSAPSVSFSGHVDFSQDNLITSAAILSSGDNVYPIDVAIDFIADTIALHNPQLSIDVEYGDGVYGTARFSSFALPVPSPDIAPCVMNGTINASFVFSEQRLSLSVPSFQIENMRHLPTSPDLSFSASGDNDGVRLDNIIISGIETEPLRGSLELSLPGHSLVLYLSSARSDEKEEIRLSIYEENSLYSGIFRADNFNFARIGFDSLKGSVNLTGSGSSLPTIAFSGSVTATSSDASVRGALSAELFLDSKDIVLSDILYEREGLRIESPSLTFSASDGTFHTSATIDAARINNDRAYPVSTSFELDASFGAEDNLFASIVAFTRDEGLQSASGRLALGETSIDNRLFIEPRESRFSYADGIISVDGNLLSGSVDIASQSFDVTLDLDPVLILSLAGEITDTGFSMKAGIENFEISVVNILFPVPTVTFIDPAPASGELYIVKDGIEWDLYGKVDGGIVAFDLFWMPNERVILHNPSFIIWENSITSLIDDCTVLDLSTYERLPGRVSLGIDLSQTLSLAQWTVDVYVRDGEEVGIRLPVQSANVDIWGDVSGHLSVIGHDNIVQLGGDITADDLRMSVGMEPMPSWWATKKKTTMDMNLLLRRNVSFVFPLGSDPILTATLAENQRLSVCIPETGGLDISGNLDIRSGEFFYFQKNFYITEGSISFPEISYGDASFNPNINLRARLRDFDSDGNPVDIFLVLRNSTLDNISPTFESSPSKNINEIMSILGGAILPTGVYGDVSVSSVFSLVSASVDILSRVGILRSSDNGLESSIRDALSLDTFSIHSNIVENILYDTVSLASSNLSEDNVSPMARYLNGTTLYLGKYISPELYFEGMVHLQSSSDREDISHSFIADDLDLDIEISLEWNNPMCTVTFFTRPGNITVYDVMDTFGFEISKRIVW